MSAGDPQQQPVLRAEHLAELLEELNPLLKGATVRDVQDLPPRDCLLILEPDPELDPAPVLRLRLSANPAAARLHLQQGRVLSHKGPVGPFFQQLAETLAGAVLRRMEQVRGDRIALLEFRAPAGARLALALELIGRHSNMALLGPADRVLGLLVPTPGRGGRPPRLSLGEPWVPPGGSAQRPQTTSLGIGDSFPTPLEPPPGPRPDRAPLSWRVECLLGQWAEQDHSQSERKRLVARLQRKLRGARGLVRGLEARSTAAEEAERVRQDGELLKAALGELQRGLDCIELTDWFDPDAPQRRIALDPKKTPQQNVERYFHRFQKLRRSRESVERESALAAERLAGLEALLQQANDPEQDPEALDAQAVARGLLDPRQEADPRKRKPSAVRLPYKVFKVHGGQAVWVGRSARDNDDLTFRRARGNDLWLHTADCPGSHVVLRMEKGQQPDQQAVLDAAMLAVHFSPARKGGGGPVHLAHIKQVSKPRGAKPGLVTLSGGKILQVRVQQARLKALLLAAQGREGPEAP